MDDLTTPIVTVAAEIGVTPDELVAKLGDDVLVDSVGFRCIERATAARLIDEHHHAQTRAAQRADERRERLAEVSRRARRSLRGGIPATHDDPLADLLAVDGLPRVEEAGARFEAWLSGRSTGARISPPTKGR